MMGHQRSISAFWWAASASGVCCSRDGSSKPRLASRFCTLASARAPTTAALSLPMASLGVRIANRRSGARLARLHGLREHVEGRPHRQRRRRGSLLPRRPPDLSLPGREGGRAARRTAGHRLGGDVSEPWRNRLVERRRRGIDPICRERIGLRDHLGRKQPPHQHLGVACEPEGRLDPFRSRATLRHARPQHRVHGDHVRQHRPQRRRCLLLLAALRKPDHAAVAFQSGPRPRFLDLGGRGLLRPWDRNPKLRLGIACVPFVRQPCPARNAGERGAVLALGDPKRHVAHHATRHEGAVVVQLEHATQAEVVQCPPRSLLDLGPIGSDVR